MRKVQVLFLLLVLFSSCHFMGGRHVRGNGNLSAQNRSTDAFNAIRLSGGMDVVLTAGPDYAIKVEADENLHKYILTDRDGDALVIRTRNGYNLRPRAGMKVYITAPSLEAITISGSGKVISESKLAAARKLDIHVTGSGDVKLNVNAPEVTAQTTGSGTIILSGATRNFEAEINGSGEVQCYDLLSENTEVRISGSGNAQVYASKQLDVHISGSGDVAYKGTPRINQRISGSGNVHNVP
jgi:hypothetical protein